MTTVYRRLGSSGPTVFPLALGCAGMSRTINQATDDAESMATIHEAIERGVNLIDTADFYGGGHNELLIGRSIRDRRDKVVLSVKFNGLRSPDGSFVGLDSRPAAIKNFLTYTLVRLGVDHVDIYRPSRLDPNVPIEETVGAMGEMVKAGYVRHIGLSELGAATVRRAQAVHPISDLQIEYSLFARKPEAEIFPVAKELGIGVTAYGVLAHGLLSGKAKPAQEGDPRNHLPWFRPENFSRNQSLVKALDVIAKDKGVSTSQIAIAWVMAKSSVFVPVVGAGKQQQLAETLASLDLNLSKEDMARIEVAVPPGAVAGARYDERLMKMLDSER